MTIATIRRVPVDLILHSLAERFKDSAEEGHDTLSLGLYACINSDGLAEEWAVSGGVAQTAEWMATIIDGRDSWREPTAAETRVAEVAVCKRLLATACNLCVTQDAEDHTAATALMQAASRILGVGTGHASAPINDYYDDEHPNARALHAAREQLQAALGRSPGMPPQTLRELIACVVAQRDAERVHGNKFLRDLLWSCAKEAAKHTGEELTVHAAEQAGVIGAALRKLAADALAKEGFRAEMHAAVGREMEMRKQVVAMQDIISYDPDAAERKVRNAIIERDAANLGRHLAAQANEKALADIRAERDEAIKQRDAHAATIENLRRIIREADGEVAAPAAKPRPQPGDVVPWTEVEDGCLYAKDWGGCRFVMVARGERSVASGPDDRDIETFLLRHDVLHPAGNKEMTLVARNLGADPEAWRKAMREWTANGNKPAPKTAESVRPLRDEFTRSIDLTGAWMCLMTGPLGVSGARWSLETTIGNGNNLRMVWPSGCTTMLADPRG